MRRLSIYFINGLLVLIPISGTVYLLGYLYDLINKIGLRWFAPIFKGWYFPGLGLLSVVIVILLVGFATRIWLTNRILAWIDSLMQKVPLAKGIYGILKDAIQSFLGEKRSFDTVVLVSVAGSKRIGFLTVKEPIFTTKDGKPYVGVYFPQSMQVAGDLHWFPKEEVEELDMTVDEALRVILSAGASQKTKKESHPQ